MSTRTLTLYPFSNNSAPEGIRVTANVARESNVLAVEFSLTDPQSLVMMQTPATSPTRCDNLWQETCFEFFLSPQGSQAYWEFNLSPSGNWNIYHLDSYRQGLRAENGFTDLPFSAKHSAHQFLLNIQIDLSPLAPFKQAIDMGITTVIKTKRGEMTYWALKHCGTKPDFHLRESFILSF
jgi:hypothetical protein